MLDDKVPLSTLLPYLPKTPIVLGLVDTLKNAILQISGRLNHKCTLSVERSLIPAIEWGCHTRIEDKQSEYNLQSRDDRHGKLLHVFGKTHTRCCAGNCSFNRDCKSAEYIVPCGGIGRLSSRFHHFNLLTPNMRITFQLALASLAAAWPAEVMNEVIKRGVSPTVPPPKFKSKDMLQKTLEGG